jgi:hypothetical protein
MPRFTFEYKFTVANVITIVLLVLGLVGMWYTVVGALAKNTDDLTVLKPVVTSLQQDNAIFNTRLSVQESRAETQAKAMDRLTDVVTDLSSSVDGLAITSATVKTDVGYIRDFVEAQKRMQATVTK